MSVPYRCERCGTLNHAKSYASYAEPRPDRCTRCGAVHSVLGNDVSVISPPCVPVPDVEPPYRRRSPWHLPWHRPVTPGVYECRFSDIEPQVLRLWWDGRYFRDAREGVRVCMRTFLTWRGHWQ